MDKSALSGILQKIIFAIFALVLVDIVYLNWWVFKSDKVQKPTETLTPVTSVATRSAVPVTSVDTTTTLPSPTTTPVTLKAPPQTIIERTQTVVQNAQKEIFIPIGSGYGSSGEFTDIAGLQVTIDTTKYSAIESAVFQGSIWVEGGNGKAYAQLYNVDDSNPIFESQISNNTSVAALQTSNNIHMPFSTKTYRVQVKTDITQYPAHIDNARIKITLK